jgi:hypothetical protein
MFESAFYHETISKCIVGFGALFSKLKVIRRDQTGAVNQVINVPISYSPKENILVRLRQDPDLSEQVRVTLPRLAFEITGYSYDSSRAQNRNQKIACYSPSGATTGVFSPVPYNLSVSMYLLTKGTQDAMSVLEQILPLFSPEYTMTINTIPTMNVYQDIPIILNSVSASYDYEGDFKSTQLTNHQLDFTLKINLYSNPGAASLITRVDTIINPNATPNPPLATYTATGNPATGVITDIWK